ncbi:MAG TPA: hypothetical protein VH306_01235 [Gaiellaceae bacterium]|jgi:hypothetical protein
MPTFERLLSVLSDLEWHRFDALEEEVQILFPRSWIELLRSRGYEVEDTADACRLVRSVDVDGSAHEIAPQ